MQDFDWDDIRHFLEVARAGSLAAAAERLGVNQSTVSRRIAALEKKLEAPLFDRSRGSGWILASAGEEIMKSAELMNDSAQRISREVLKNSTELTGHIKVTFGDTGTHGMFVPTIAKFARQYPQIGLSLHISDMPLDLAAREADVAIRVTDNPPANVVGKRVGTVGMAIYGNTETVARLQAGDKSVPLIRWSGDMGQAKDWIQQYFSDHAISHDCNTLPVKIEMVLQGLGVTVLPIVLARRAEGLVPVPGCQPFAGPGLWILSHVDLRTTARVRLFRDYLFDMFSAKASAIAGLDTADEAA